MLEVRNLHAKIGDKEILKGVEIPGFCSGDDGMEQRK